MAAGSFYCCKLDNLYVYIHLIYSVESINLSKGRVGTMKTVNALKIRNNLGEILDLLEKTKEPILVSKGREIRAVLITP